MNPSNIKRLSLLLLGSGWGAALVIYFTAKPVELDPLLGDPLTTKRYVHELSVIGGKGNVLAAEFVDGWEGLWHGQALAGTVAVLTVMVTLAFRFVAAHPELLADDPPAPKNPAPPRS